MAEVGAVQRFTGLRNATRGYLAPRALEQAAALLARPPLTDTEALAWARDLQSTSANYRDWLADFERDAGELELTDEVARQLAPHVDAGAAELAAGAVVYLRRVLVLALGEERPELTPRVADALASALQDLIGQTLHVLAWLEDVDDTNQAILALADNAPRIPHAEVLGTVAARRLDQAV